MIEGIKEIGKGIKLLLFAILENACTIRIISIGSKYSRL